MAKQDTKEESSNVFSRNLPHINVGTIGQKNYGKTTLTAAITQVLANDGYDKAVPTDQIDKSNEEQEKDITINNKHLDYATKYNDYNHVDVPGDPQYVKNMYIGASQMDSAILVVSADGGPQVGTNQNLILAKQAGVKHLIVFLNKVDQVHDKNLVKLMELEIRDLLMDYNYDGRHVPIIAGSALKALSGDSKAVSSIKELLLVMTEYIPVPFREYTKPFLMQIEHVFDKTGIGTIVSGKISRGSVKNGDQIELAGLMKSPKPVTVDNIQTFGKDLPIAIAGDDVGILLHNVKASDVKIGQYLAAQSSVEAHTKLSAQIYTLIYDEGGRHSPFKSGYAPQFFFGTANVNGKIYLEKGSKMILPGDRAGVNITLNKPMVLYPKEPFTFREGHRTIGYGVITNIK